MEQIDAIAHGGNDKAGDDADQRGDENQARFTRTNDGGNYSPFKSPVTCNCYFDLHATGATSCQMCSASSDCPRSAPNCNKFGPQPQQGYCDL